jgi:YVTN family beta-propeller protein
MARCRIKWIVCIALVCCISCTHESKVLDPTGSNYPKEVAAIFLNKCATSGCHNNSSYVNADEFNLSTWDNLFKGSTTGSAVIPYRPDFSSLCFFTNTDSSLGITLQPTMPYNTAPLSKSEYLRLKDWIAAGAPDAKGNIKFADDTARSKYYVTNRLCNVVTIIDAASRLQMRYIDVGDNVSAKYPYCIKVAPDKKNWYISFFAQTNIVQQYNATNDKYAGDINLGAGTWTSFAISSDSKHGWFVDNSMHGQVAYVDLENRSVLATYTFGGNFKYPTGIALDEHLNKLYVGVLNGNFLYRIDITDPLNPLIHEMPIDGTGIVNYQTSIDPVELIADEQSNRCYIACIATGEIRVLDMQQDSVIAKIPLGSVPAFMGFSAATQKLFVSCPDDVNSFAGNRGAVAVIDAGNNTVIKRINTGYQPYGIAVDDVRGVVTVVNANISSGGPASHHVSGCGKKNGNVTFIDLHTMELVPHKQLEVTVFPFGAAVR